MAASGTTSQGGPWRRRTRSWRRALGWGRALLRRTVPSGWTVPSWRRVLSALVAGYLGLSSVGFVLAILFAVPSGSMDLQAGTSPGILLTGTFHYPYVNPTRGRTVDIPVTAPARSTDPGRVVVDTTEFVVLDGSDYGPFGTAGTDSVALPAGVHLDHELNGTALLQPLRTGSRLALAVDSPVGWRGRLLVALPSVLIWTGLWIATVSFGLFLRSILDGRPFDPENPRRLLWLGGSLTAVLAADSWLRVAITRAVLDVLNRSGHPIPLQADAPGINPGPVYVIVGVLFLAAAFRVGTRIAADTEGLV